jgi:hypothetical protein
MAISDSYAWGTLTRKWPRHEINRWQITASGWQAGIAAQAIIEEFDSAVGPVFGAAPGDETSKRKSREFHF